MIVFPFAKVNLGLQVLRLRADGYRDIETVFLPIPLRDALEMVIDPELPSGDLVFTRSGISVPGVLQDDLCFKAVQLLGKGHSLPGLRMHLHKAIPLGAGLGGGSSDAAHVLRMGNTLLGLGHTQKLLTAMAASLGSDCAFFLQDDPQRGTGRGEVLWPIPLDLAGNWLVLVNPGLHVPTSEVYAHTPTRDRDAGALLKALLAPRDEWHTTVVNDLEPYVLRTRPEVAAIKEALQQAGAWYTSMSGSGSSVFGLFAEQPKALTWPAGYLHRVFPL